MSEEKTLLTELQKAWAEFKTTNDQRLAELDKGKADVVLADKVDRINAAISDLQGKLEQVALDTAGQRMSATLDTRYPEATLAEFSRSVGRPVDAAEYSDYIAGLDQYLRRGNATPKEVMAALSVGSDPDGGYTVTPDMSGRIAQRIYETSPMRQAAFVTSIGTDSLEGFNDLDEAGSGWVGETAAREETTTPKIGKWTIPVHEIFAEPKATQKLLDDSAWNIESWLSAKVADKFAREENKAFLTGDGLLKPRGLLTYPTAATADADRAWGTFEHVNTGADGNFLTTTAATASDPLIDFVFTLKSDYRRNASWMMNRGVVARVRKLKDGDGNYLWAPDFAARQGGLLLGYPIIEAEDMPALATNSLSIAFGDFREAYTIVDRVGIRLLRDPYTTKGFVKFYSTKRVGGGATHFESVKFLRFAAS